METKNKILVTGGAGYIGSHTIIELINAGYEPVVVDNFSNSNAWILQNVEEITGQKIKFYQIDCREYNQLKEILKIEKKIEGIIHFAAYKSVSESVASPLKYYENNLGSLTSVLKLVNTFGIPRFVFSSSCTVYGQADELPVSEKTPIKPAESPYGYTKQVGEQMILDTLKNNAVLLRYFNPVGAHPSGLIGELPNGKPENLVPFITQTATGIREKLMVFGNDYNTPDGSCVRDFIHVVDLAKAHVAALDYIKDQKPTTAFNIGTGEGNTVLEAIRLFEEVNNVKLNYEITARRPGDIEKIYADTTKADEVLGWKAGLGLREALRDSWNWECYLRKVKQVA